MDAVIEANEKVKSHSLKFFYGSEIELAGEDQINQRIDQVTFMIKEAINQNVEGKIKFKPGDTKAFVPDGLFGDQKLVE